MLDLRRPAALHDGRLAVAAVLAVMSMIALWWSAAPSLAATGEVSSFGRSVYPATADDQFYGAGPVALDPGATSDPSDDSVFVADLDANANPHIRKLTRSGEVGGSAFPVLTDPSGKLMYIVGLAADPELGRLYALVDADVNSPQAGSGTAREVLVYSTTPDCSASPCTLVPPSDIPGGVLIDFRVTTGVAVDFASGIAVDRQTNKVAILGVDDYDAVDPTGILQYISSNGTPSTRVTGFGPGLEPGGTTAYNPSGLAIGPDGEVYVATSVPTGFGFPYSEPFASESVYKMTAETGASSLVLADTSLPLGFPGAKQIEFSTRLGTGSSIAVATDGETVYLPEGDATAARIRGFSTASGALKVIYGGATEASSACKFVLPYAIAVAAGDGQDVAAVFTDFAGGLAGATPTVRLFGEGGTGCPRAVGAFTVNGSSDETITVTKGQNVTFDANGSQLLGGTPSSVDWDFDNSGDFATHPTGTPPPLTLTRKFLEVKTYHVGVRIGVDGAPPTDPVFRDVKVVAPTPTASFKVSNKTPAAGASVSFDAGDSVDPAGSSAGGPSNGLKSYRWDFGDGGQPEEATSKTIAHAFANAGTATLSRTVKLTVVSNDDMASSPVTQTLTVAGTPQTPPPPGNTQTNPTTTQTTPAVTPPPVITPPAPKLSGPSVDSKGVLSLKVACPAGGVACTGKIALTVKIKQKVKGKTKTTTVKLGTATFSIDPGKSKDVKLRLSSAGKSLLKKQKKLSATAVISTTAGGQTKPKNQTLTLKAPAKK